MRRVQRNGLCKVLTRAEILASDPARLERLGRRLMVGFESFSEVKTLVEKRAVAGIFITDQIVRGRKADDIAKDIRGLQDIRKSQNLPRLLVAADQEGGYVSRLSPPLKRQPSLGQLISPLKTDADREKAVRAYADEQAHELERIGITMNFGPVVDLRLGGPGRDDGETRLYWRAMSSDPFLVAKVAGWYCDALTKFNIICTLKHFRARRRRIAPAGDPEPTARADRGRFEQPHVVVEPQIQKVQVQDRVDHELTRPVVRDVAPVGGHSNPRRGELLWARQ